MFLTSLNITMRLFDISHHLHDVICLAEKNPLHYDLKMETIEIARILPGKKPFAIFFFPKKIEKKSRKYFLIPNFHKFNHFHQEPIFSRAISIKQPSIEHLMAF